MVYNSYGGMMGTNTGGMTGMNVGNNSSLLSMLQKVVTEMDDMKEKLKNHNLLSHKHILVSFLFSTIFSRIILKIYFCISFD